VIKIDLSKQTKSKKQILVLILLVAVCVFLSSCGKKTQKVYRVGIVSGAEPFADIADGFKAKMTELGYTEGKNIIYDLQKVTTGAGDEQQIARKFVEDNVDLIFAFPTEPAVAAKTATQGTNIPVVFALAGIEGNNLVESISKPGRNITGVRFPGPELTVKRLELLHELAPDAKRVYLIYDPNYPTASSALKQLHSVASSMNATLVEDTANNIKELNAALQKRSASDDIGIDAILIMPEILTQTPDGFGALLKFANEHKVPIGGSICFTADLGAMFSLIPDNVEMGKQAAVLADKIFKGTPAGSIMVVTPDSRLRLNYKVIQELGLTVPEGLLSMADEVIR
jgi:putative ABC transport system substrate-binding protein